MSLTEKRKLHLIYMVMFSASILISLLTFSLLNVSASRYREGYIEGQEDLIHEIESQAIKTDRYILETENLIYTLELINSATITKP